MGSFADRLAALGCATEFHDDLLRVRIPAGQSQQLLWEVAAAAARANPLFAASAEHARRGLLECRGAHLMPIFDQGYQHWSGHLSSHAWRWLAITRRGVRTALQGRIVRLALILAWLPAIVLVVVLCLWGLVERQSALVDSIKPLAHVISRPADSRRASRLSRRNLDALFPLFSIVGVVVFDGARAARRSKSDQPGPALQCACRSISRARCVEWITLSENWA